ncbi:MAG: hypothetical protein VYD19_03730 [Myxococcota bacterium]|nr:hypothetical protein [Myxococcota bacterium]
MSELVKAIILLALLSGVARAEEAQADEQEAPAPVSTESTVPSTDGETPSSAQAGTDAPAAESQPPAPVKQSRDQNQRLAPYRPVSRFAIGGVRIEAPAQAALTWNQYPEIPLDKAGTPFAPSATSDLQLRLGLNIDSLITREAVFAIAGIPVFLKAELEADLVSGVISGGAPEVEGFGYPFTNERAEMQLRKGYGQLSFASLFTVGGGYMTSHWGLGLVANDGAHSWSPGCACFRDSRGGDVVKRAFFLAGPWTSQELAFIGAMDQAERDDMMLAGDSAEQFVLAAIWGYKRPRQLGAYFVKRRQESAAGGVTEVTVADIFGQWSQRAGAWDLQAAFEGVLIDGTTEWAPTPEYPESDVVQLAFNLHLEAGRVRSASPWGAVLDLIYASGDQNFEDGVQNAFAVDPNIEMGLLIHPYILSAQSARAIHNAADPYLSGRPVEDLERFPSRDRIQNSWLLAPRLWARPYASLELYGGPLLAWGDVPLADPLNSKVGGGYPVNSLGGAGDRWLGTELDLGVRSRSVWHGVEVLFGVEGAVLFPGGAFGGGEAALDDPLYAARFLSRLRF